MSTKRHSKRNELNALQASVQEQLPAKDVSLKELFNERKRFETFPEFQRKQCWGTRQKQALIDTILLGDPIPPLEGYQEFFDPSEVENDADAWQRLGQSRWRIVDGQQRILTILEFMDGGFKTWTAAQKRAAEPASDPPVEPGKFFDELSIIAKNYFLEYRLQINKVRNKSPMQMGIRFLRIQNHLPLSAAEKLNIYASKANTAARRIEHHLIWSEDFYEGKSIREQTFQSSLHLLALEMAAPSGIVDLQSWSFIHGLAAGRHDSKITDTLVDEVLARLDVVAHVYSGTHFTIRAAIVPMYQSIMFLEQAGYTIQPKDKGKLTNWISAIISESTRASGLLGYNQPIQRILRESVQRDFWVKHRTTVMRLFGINTAA